MTATCAHRLAGITTPVFTHVNPVNDGILPGRAYRWKVSAPVTTDGGTCARVKAIMGGAKGDKIAIKAGGVPESVEAWRDRVQAEYDAGRAPLAVVTLASGIYDEFFSRSSLVPPDLHSPFNFAPAIWIQQDVKVCADGSVKPGSAQIAYSGYMPDLYLYVDGQPVDLLARPTVGPAQTGDFARFSNPPSSYYPVYERSPWNECNTNPAEPGFLSLRDGIPWKLEFDNAADESPDTVRFCDEPWGSGSPHDG